MKKLCKKKCKNCKGMKCINYVGLTHDDKRNYYEGVLHSKKVSFGDDK